MKRLVMLATLTLALSACSEPAATGPHIAPPKALAALASKPVLNARGSGIFRQHPQRTFAFNARLMADGSAKGEYNLTIGGGVKIHGDVTCMTGNGAGRVWVGGVVTGGGTWPVGSRIGFSAQDNGKAADQITLVTWDGYGPDSGFDQDYCANKYEFGLYTVERGNITVAD